MSFGLELLELERESGVHALALSTATDERGDTWTSFLKGDLEALLPNSLDFKHDQCSQSHHKAMMSIG